MNAVIRIDGRAGTARRRAIAQFLKAAFDRVAAAIALGATAPLFALVSLAILCERRGPILFRQLRPGRGGAPFRIYKFRTMREAYGPDGMPLPDSERLTRLGAFLRRTSLDELPQLWNVLRGDLSLVGPRPLLMEYLPHYTPEQARRHDVRPGITGWAQVNGRNALSWEQKLACDMWYVDHWSLALDCKILFITLVRVFRAEGIRSPENRDMEAALLAENPPALRKLGGSSTPRT